MLKTNTKLLVITLAVLSVLLIIYFMFFKEERSFREHLVKFDVSKVDNFKISSDERTVSFFKENNRWYVSDGAGNYIADQTVVNDLVNALSAIKIDKLVSNDESKWEEYEVTNALGSTVEVFKGKKLLAEIIIGRFSYRQVGQGISMSTMVRLQKEKEIYSVDGSINMQTKRTADNFRDKTILSFDPETVQKVEVLFPMGNSYVLSYANDEWMINHRVASIGKVINYLNEIKETKGNTFIKEVDTDNLEEYKLIVHTTKGLTVTVKVYKTADERYAFVTTQNDGILVDSEYLFKKMFPQAERFVD